MNSKMRFFFCKMLQFEDPGYLGSKYVPLVGFRSKNGVVVMDYEERS